LEDYAVNKRVAPSVELEAAIERLLAEGLADAERLGELGRLGARLAIQLAVEEEVDAFLGRTGTSGRRRRAAGGTGTGRGRCRPPRASWRSRCRRSGARPRSS
jgi:putative transposase